jgi:mannose-6-phosphate isomerase
MIEELVQYEFYTVSRITLTGEETLVQNKAFLVASVIEGEGTIDNIEIRKGDHFILPAFYREYCLKGKMQLITSNI